MFEIRYSEDNESWTTTQDGVSTAYLTCSEALYGLQARGVSLAQVVVVTATERTPAFDYLYGDVDDVNID